MLVPYGTNLDKIVPTYEFIGKGVAVLGVPQESGKTANNFNNPILYSAVANDSTYTDYTIIVDKGSIDSKKLKTFGFLARNNNLKSDVYGVFLGYNVNVILPYGSSLNPLVAKFTTNGVKSQVSGVDQISEHTTNDFSKLMLYKIFAADGTFAEYKVVTAADDSTAEYSIRVKLEEITTANCIVDKSYYDDGCILSQ